MANMIAEEHVRCGPTVIASLIEPALRRLSNGETLSVRVPSDVIGIRSPITLEQEVRFRFAHACEQDGLNDILTISWEPEGNIFVPAFCGILTSDPDVDSAESILVLQGAYSPPGGPVGKAFDEAFGFRIARATMHDLLRRLARAIEALVAERSTSAASKP
jgi:hypothetical protein